MEVNQDNVILAVSVISEALEEADITKLEGAVAMLSILEQLKKEGLDIQCVPTRKL